MPIHEIRVNSKQYSIELDVDDLLHILNTDQLAFNEDLLSERLYAIPGVDKIEYNGHFGAYIYLTILADCDNEDTWKQIKKMINKAIDRS